MRMKFKYLKPSVVGAFFIAFSFSTSSCGLIVGAIGTAVSLLPAKIALSCLPEGTAIDTPSGPMAIEHIVAGDLVIGFEGTPVKVLQVHNYLEDSTAERFRTVEFTNGSKVDLCDKHRIGNIRAEDLKAGSSIESGEIVQSVTVYGGVERSYDLLTEDAGYQINSIPVNSMIEELIETAQTGLLKR